MSGSQDHLNRSVRTIFHQESTQLLTNTPPTDRPQVRPPSYCSPWQQYLSLEWPEIIHTLKKNYFLFTAWKHFCLRFDINAYILLHIHLFNITITKLPITLLEDKWWETEQYSTVLWLIVSLVPSHWRIQETTCKIFSFSWWCRVMW